MSSTISTKIKLEGEKEYREALSNINQQQKTLKAEMNATTSAYDKNTTAEKKNADQSAYLSKQQELQAQKIQKLREMVDKATKAYGENDNKTLKLKQSLANAEAEQSKMTSTTETNTKAVADNSTSFGNLSEVMAAAAVAAGVLKTAYDSLSETMNNLDDLATTSAQSGFSKQTIQEWQYASEMVDVSVEDIISSARRMKKNMADSPDAFSALGVAVTDASGNMRDAEDVFNDTVSALGSISNETERDQAAMDIFGKSADELAGIIDDGGASLRSYMQQAEDLGLVLSDDTISSVNAAKDSVDSAKAAWEAAKTSLDASVLQAFSPVIKTVAAAFTSLSSAIASAPQPVKDLVAVVSTAIIGFAALTAAVKGVAVIKTLTTTLPAIATALTGTAASSGAAATGLTALGTASAASAGGVTAMGAAMSTLADAGIAVVGIGAGILFAASGFSILADSAIKLSTAGSGAQITLVAMAAGVVGLGVALAALSPVMTAGALGIGIFGAAMFAIGGSIGIATSGIGAMMDGFADYNKSVSELAKNGEVTASSLLKISDAEGSMTASSMALGTGIATTVGPMKKINAAAAAGVIAMSAYALATSAADKAASALADSLQAVYSIIKKIGGSSVSVGSTSTSGVRNYATAMDQGTILTGATIFGTAGGKLLQAGEVASETVVGTGSLMSMIGRAVNKAVTNNYGGATINVYGGGQNANEIADRVLELVNNQQRVSKRMGAH